MFSGKSSRLISYIDRCKYQRRTVAAFKPAMDDRFGSSFISTHGGLRVEATCVKTGAQLLEVLLSLPVLPEVVALDEAWMVSGSASALIDVFRMGISVAVASIDLLANGKETTEVMRMLPWATHVETCAAVCTVCGQDAFYSHMRVQDDRDVCIGGSELYESRCYAHAPAINLKPAAP